MTREVKNSEVQLSENCIAKEVKEIAVSICNEYDDLSQLTLVGVMDGAICFLSDLMRELRTCELGKSILVTTARAESYKGTGPKGSKIHYLPSQDCIKGRNVLIVEDLVSKGKTCKIVKTKLKGMGAKSVKICALVHDTHHGQKCHVQVDYCGFKVPHPFWAGYGLDCKDKYRNLPYIKRLDQVGEA